MSEENLEPGLGADNPDNSCAPETKAGNEPQSLWGELSDEQKSFLSRMEKSTIAIWINFKKSYGQTECPVQSL